MTRGAARAALVGLLLFSGCAGREIVTAPPAPGPPPAARRARPPLQAESSYERIFPSFAAVVAREGDTCASLAARFLGDAGMGWYVAEFNGLAEAAPGDAIVIPLAPYDPLGVREKSYKTVPVLCYHKFSKTVSDKMTVTEASFDAQMRLLRENGYRVISLERLFDFLEGKAQIPAKSVVITIDDGWRSTYDIAYPILRKYGYPATLFAYTDFIGGGANALTWEMVAALSRGGIDVQCHTKTHRNLARRSRREQFDDYFNSLVREINESSRILKRRLNKEIRYLAYPYGDTNHLVVALAGKAGFRGALTVVRGGNPFFAQPYRVSRSIIYGTYDLRDFENNLIVSDDKALQ